MPNDFIGDLSKTRFFDLMKPLLARKKSGLLLVKGVALSTQKLVLSQERMPFSL
jgi:hypothetical protein